jgi:hypothetical protein
MIVSVKEAIVETVHARVGAWVYVLPIRSISLMCHSTIQEWSENDKYKENRGNLSFKGLIVQMDWN